MVKIGSNYIAQSVYNLRKANQRYSMTYRCNTTGNDLQNETRANLINEIKKTLESSSTYVMQPDRFQTQVISPSMGMTVNQKGQDKNDELGLWETLKGFTPLKNLSAIDQKRFYRIGKLKL